MAVVEEGGGGHDGSGGPSHLHVLLEALREQRGDELAAHLGRERLRLFSDVLALLQCAHTLMS